MSAIADTTWGKIGHGRCLPDGTYHTRCLHGLVLSVFRERQALVGGAHRCHRWQWRAVVDGKERGAFHTLKSAKHGAEQIADRLTSAASSL